MTTSRSNGGALTLTNPDELTAFGFDSLNDRVFYESGSIKWKGVADENAFTNAFNGWVDVGNVTSAVHSAAELKSMLWFIGGDAI